MANAHQLFNQVHIGFNREHRCETPYFPTGTVNPERLYVSVQLQCVGDPSRTLYYRQGQSSGQTCLKNEDCIAGEICGSVGQIQNYGFGVCAQIQNRAPEAGDCPEAEVCDSVDNDHDGDVDEGLPNCFNDFNGEGGDEGTP